ncbi:mycothiol-dependent nitroreductase Rv2466c family protein [Nocardiopsis codii]|nr:hypothetical protein [Nocardiopsis sp. CT-R113]
MYTAAALWGLGWGGVPTLFQTAAADAGGDAADTAQAVLVPLWDAAMAGGGVLLAVVGTAALPWSVLALLAPVLAVRGPHASVGGHTGPRPTPLLPSGPEARRSARHPERNDRRRTAPSIAWEADMADDRWTVDFWLDPSCPLTRNTARWITSLTGHVPLDVRWHVMSLFLLNEHRDEDPEGDTEGYLRIPARVATAVRSDHGNDALGAFHDALWTDPDGTHREWIGDIADALRRCGLPADLADAGWGTGYDAALRESHQDGVGRVDAEIGTPVLAVTTPDGALPAVFGPVVAEVPSQADAVRLWQATLLLAGVPGFRELKR